jgi:hypothetical protein
LKIYFSFSAKRSINSRHPHNDGVRKPRLTPLQWICVRDKSAIRLCSMPSVRGVDIDPIFAAQDNKEFRFDESSLPKSSLGPFQ